MAAKVAPVKTVAQKIDSALDQIGSLTFQIVCNEDVDAGACARDIDHKIDDIHAALDGNSFADLFGALELCQELGLTPSAAAYSEGELAVLRNAIKAVR